MQAAHAAKSHGENQLDVSLPAMFSLFPFITEMTAESVALTPALTAPTVRLPGGGKRRIQALRIFNPFRPGIARRLTAAALAMAFMLVPPLQSAYAQEGLNFIRDTETERMLRSYLDPILRVAGLSPASVHLYIVNDPSINAFVAEGQNVFVFTGLIMQLDTPNEVTGVLAHETGHMAHGDLVHSSQAMRAATIPMLIGMAAGIAAMALGAGDAGQALIMGSQQIGEREYLRYSRSIESNADQAGVRFLTATHQSGDGMLRVFKRFENEEMMTSQHIDKFAYNHPVSQDRINLLQRLVETSPYRDEKDPAVAQHQYDMVRAKLRGYIQQTDTVYREYPPSDTSKAARYARAIAYFREPDMKSALKEINALIADEPNNPYFQEVLGQIMVEMARPAEGIAPYRKSVQLAPDAPLLRIALASAMLATEDPAQVAPAAKELEIALRQEPDNDFGWYEAAEAYGRLNQPGKADLATAERYYAVGNYRPAMQFAFRAQKGLSQSTVEWQRANDILATAQAQANDNR
jgi:predicted Zn-dependent protease